MAVMCSDSSSPLYGRFACKLGERATSDVIVRLRTLHGRDDWFYSHSQILTSQSAYFALRLSDAWPTSHLLDARPCVEVVCIESDIDHHVTLLRLLYSAEFSDSGKRGGQDLGPVVGDSWHSVKHALGVLKVATKLGCDAIATQCARYLEAVPWEESEEEEILRALPAIVSAAQQQNKLGGVAWHVQPVLARLQPVDAASVRNVFLSAVHMATSTESREKEMHKFPSDLKVAAQEQVEYMLEEDDDAPLLIADDDLRSELKVHFLKLFQGFKSELSALVALDADPTSEKSILEKVSDLVWASRVLPHVGLNPDFVEFWVEASFEVAQFMELIALQLGGPLEIVHDLLALSSEKLRECFWDTKLRVMEITSMVLKAVGYGSVILTATERTRLVKVWLPFIRATKPVLDSLFAVEKMSLEMDVDLCQSIENALVSLVLSLPSGDQAEILADWLRWDHARFPDLSEAFEVWCFRTKAAKRRLCIEVPKVTSAISTGGAS